jgi:hypothetical protein
MLNTLILCYFFIAKAFENIEIREKLFLLMTIIVMIALLQAKVDFVLKYF